MPIRLVASAANQTHFKLIVVNNQSADVATLVDYENVFEFDELASGMALAIGHEPEGDFAAATEHVKNTTSIGELLAFEHYGYGEPASVLLERNRAEQTAASVRSRDVRATRVATRRGARCAAGDQL